LATHLVSYRHVFDGSFVMLVYLDSVICIYAVEGARLFRPRPGLDWR